MSTSSVPTFKAQLKTNLLARTGLANVQVTHGPPAPVPEAEFIWLGDVRGSQDWAAGQALKSEIYELTVWIRVLASTAPDDFKTAGDRVFALLAELENELRGDKTVTGTVTSAQVTDFDFQEDATGEQTLAVIEVTVQVTTFI